MNSQREPQRSAPATETPWQPDADYITRHNLLAYRTVLVSPAGICHLAFNSLTGGWVRLLQDGSTQKVTAGEAALLRPADVDQIIKITVGWSWFMPASDNRRNEMVNDLAAGVKRLVLAMAAKAGEKPLPVRSAGA